MKIELPERVASPQDLRALILDIKQYGRWFSHESIKRRSQVSKASAAPVVSPDAVALLRAYGDNGKLTESKLDDLIAGLEDFAATAASVTVTLAAPPGGDLKKTLVAWCRRNIASDILVTFDFNSTLLGGMVVRYGSHIFDWSFRSRILAARGRFPEVLRRV